MPNLADHRDQDDDRNPRQARRLAASLLGALLLTAPLVAGAADAEGRFAVKGAGATTCADFASAVEERGQRLIAYGGWLEGYHTYANQNLDQTFDLASWETPQTLALLLLNHCRSNPDISFLDATRMMFGALQAARIESSSELVVARDGERGVRLYRETMRRVQSRLSAEGLYKGEVDGLFGEGTRTAISAFQKNAGLEATGLPDQSTLMRLLRNPQN